MVSAALACLAAAWLVPPTTARPQVAARECPAGEVCGAGSLMLQWSHKGAASLLEVGDGGLLEAALGQGTSSGTEVRRRLAELQAASRRLAERSVAEAGRGASSPTPSPAGPAGPTAQPPSVGKNDSAQAKIIADVLDQLNRTIFSGMLADHAEDQGEVNKHVGHINQCHTDMLDDNLTRVAHSRTEAHTRSAERAQCLVAQSQLDGNRRSACSAAHSHFKSNLVDPKCQLGTEPVAEVLSKHLECIKRFAAKIPDAEAEYWKCNNATSAHTAKVAACTSKTDLYHSAYCVLGALGNATCDLYVRCYVEQTARYATVKRSVETVEAGRKTEVLAVEKIRCYLLVVAMPAKDLAGDAGLAHLAKCDQISNTTEQSRFNINYPPTPASQTCSLGTDFDGLPQPAIACPSQPAETFCDHYRCPRNYAHVAEAWRMLGSTKDRCCVLQPSLGGGVHTSAFVNAAGGVWMAGLNDEGQLGVGTTDNVLIPTRPVGLASPASKVAAGVRHTLFLLADGTVMSAGRNKFGELGDGTATRQTTPVKVLGVDSVVDIACGYYHSLFVRGDGTVWGVGHNTHFPLGIAGAQNTPWQIQGFPTPVESAEGGYHYSVFLMTDGTVMGLGRNNEGQLGLGSQDTVKVPTAVPTISDAVQVAAKHRFTVILLKDGTVRAMGQNHAGQLGDGTMENRNAPVVVQGVAGVTTMAVSWDSAYFVLPNGKVLAVGRNKFFELCDGTNTNRSSAVATRDYVGNVTGVGCGHKQVYFLQADLSIRAAGLNGHGALGDGTTMTTNNAKLIATPLAAAGGAPLSLA